jgi:hypothetical protein
LRTLAAERDFVLHDVSRQGAFLLDR